MDESINNTNEKQIRQKPALSGVRIVGEIMAGMGMGFPVKLLAACIGVVVFLGGGIEANPRIDFMAKLTTFTLPLYGIFCAVGVYLVGSRGKRTGSYLLTLAFGFLTGLLVIAMLSLVRGAPVLIIRYALDLLIQPIAATIGFNLTRRYKDSTKAIDESINIQDEMQSPQKPPISRSRIVVEILAGTALGIVVTLVLYVIFVVFFGGRDYSGSVGQLQALGIVGMFISVFPLFYGLGSAVGVYFVSRKGNQTGSFLATLGGGFLGGLVTIGMLPLAMKSLSIVELAILVWIFLFLPLVLLGAPIMATLGFNLTRGYKEPSSLKSTCPRLTLFQGITLAVFLLIACLIWLGITKFPSTKVKSETYSMKIQTVRKRAREAASANAIEGLKSPDQGVRSRSARILGWNKEKTAVEALIICLQDQDSSVRSSAARALANIADPRAMEPLVKALGDENYLVRTCAVNGLEVIGNTSCIPALEKLAQTDPKSRDSIERAIDAIKKREDSEK